MRDEEEETFENNTQPVTFDRLGDEGQDPSEFVEGRDEPPDAESED